jgi:hypothetical protein
VSIARTTARAGTPRSTPDAHARCSASTCAGVRSLRSFCAASRFDAAVARPGSALSARSYDAIAASTRPVSLSRLPRLLCAAARSGSSASARPSASIARSASPARWHALPRLTHAADERGSIAIAASSARSASPARPAPLSAAPRWTR